jgi:uncharacterized RDD family membrane protein YckC
MSPSAVTAAAGGDRRRRAILTPEGVELSVELAGLGERAAAFLLDNLFITAATIVAVVVIVALVFALRGWGLALGWTGVFLLRSFYFSFFELHWRGATPGKRIFGLRVIDRSGGPLQPEAVVARNLMREIEFTLPLSLLFLPGFGGLIQLLFVAWAGIFLLMPLFNRDSLRVGDIVGGTLVIALPRPTLPPDLVAAPAVQVPARYSFTPAQLDIYGIHELQTLERVLRRGAASAAVRPEIAQRIVRKIGWTDDRPGFDADAFLDAFYQAQRARLERKLLFGVRRKDKHDRG